MLAMERLSPLERAAFLLHDVFGFSFNEVAQAIGRDSAACRQLAARARAHVRNSRPRFPVSAEQSQSIVDAFFTATRGGDLKALVSLLSENVVTYTDGGGKVPSAYRPVIGCDKVSGKSLFRWFASQARLSFPVAGGSLPYRWITQFCVAGTRAGANNVAFD